MGFWNIYYKMCCFSQVKFFVKLFSENKFDGIRGKVDVKKYGRYVWRRKRLFIFNRNFTKQNYINSSIYAYN